MVASGHSAFVGLPAGRECSKFNAVIFWVRRTCGAYISPSCIRERERERERGSPAALLVSVVFSSEV